ncbi:MAG: restriction endonuclease subunit S [Treponema sp.]|jgi:hypothetical protein|nr:restriction endonuclease subunit S [Treponema sp.]
MARIVSLHLGDVTRFHDEKRISLSRRQCEQQSGEFPYYGAQGIIARINTFAYEGEYLLFACAPPHNVPALPALPVSGRFSANTHVHVLACIEEVEPRFLCRCLNTLPRSVLPRSPQPADIEDIEISLPPPEDQRQILAALSDIENKTVLLQNQNRLLDGMAQSLFDHRFVFGSGKLRPLGDFIISRTLPDPGLPQNAGTAFHNLLLYPREDLPPLFVRLLIKNPEFLAHAKNCLEHRSGRQQLNAELLMTFELTGPAEPPGGAFPAGAYPEFAAFAFSAEQKLSANNAELKLLAALGQSLFPPSPAAER